MGKENPKRGWKVRGGLRIVVPFFLLGVAICSVAFLPSHFLDGLKPKILPPVNPSDSSTRISAEKILGNGKKYDVVVRFAGALHDDIVEEISGMEVSIDGKPVNVPQEAWNDLRSIHASNGLQITEVAQDACVILSGGEGASTWQAKLLVHDNYVSTRETKRTSGPPIVLHFAPPLDPHQGIIPPAELAKLRANIFQSNTTK